MHKRWSMSLGANNVLDRKATDSPNELFVLSGTPTIKRRNWTVSATYRW